MIRLPKHPFEPSTFLEFQTSENIWKISKNKTLKKAALYSKLKSYLCYNRRQKQQNSCVKSTIIFIIFGF